MSIVTELDRFFMVWEAEARKTVALMRSLPEDKYDFRPDPRGRSLGELAWHLAECDSNWSARIEKDVFGTEIKIDLTRPKSIVELAPGYERVHATSIARVRRLNHSDLDRRLTAVVIGEEASVRDWLWSGTLLHLIHHRGQLALLCRMAGGAPPGMYGPNREAMAALRAKSPARTAT